MTGTYTLDKLVVLMRCRASTISALCSCISSGASDRYGTCLKDWFSGKVGSYKYNYTLGAEGESWYLGVMRWDDRPSSYWCNIKVEFNPAKVSDLPAFTAFYDRLISCAKYLDFQRFDVAIDLPVARERVQLRKDQRRYSEVCYSPPNRTQYLGLRSSHGYIKVYNKALESGLSGDLTRVEITVDYAQSSWAEFRRIFPEVYIISGTPTQVTGTDYVLLLACLDDINRLSLLGKDKRKKIEQLLREAAPVLEADEINYKSILQDILAYGKTVPMETWTEIEEDAAEFEPAPDEQPEITSHGQEGL